MAHQNGKLESLKFSLCTFSKYSFDSNLNYFKRRLRYLFPCQYSKQALIYLTTYITNFDLFNFYQVVPTVIVWDDATLGAIHVGGGNEGDVTQLEDGAHQAEDVVDLLRTQAKILHRFLQRKQVYV